MSDKVKVAVVGVGFFGERHVRAFSEIQNAQLIAVVDADGKRAEAIAKQYGCESYTNIAPLIGKIDAASIVTPTAGHTPVAKSLLMAGIDLLIEKPFTATLQEADELNQIAKEKGRIIQVGHVERFNPALVQLKELITAPRFIECHRMGPFVERAANVSVILDLMIHDIDIVLSLVSSDLVNVHATGVSVVSHNIDIAHARLFFADGTVANLMASRVSEERVRTVRIFQKQAYLSLDYLQRALTIYSRGPAQEGEERPHVTREKYTFEQRDALKSQLCAFIEIVHHRQPPIVSGIEGRAALSVALQIVDRIKTSSDFK
jgi:predicted dehydrogenase